MGRKSIDKTRKSNEEKKQQWAAAAFPLFQLGGLADLTMDGIARWLGKSKSTLYEYFESKDEMMLYALLGRLTVLQDYEAILTNTNISFTERYKSFLAFMLPHISDISNSFLVEMKAHFPTIWRLLDQFLRGLLGHLDDYHRGGIAAGEFKPLSVALMVRMDGLFISEVLMQPTFLVEQQLSLKDLVEQYILLKFEGVRL